MSALCQKRTSFESQHLFDMNVLISLGSAKITSARSPIIPALTSPGAFFSGPSPLASVFKRRLRSQNLRVWPAVSNFLHAFRWIRLFKVGNLSATHHAAHHSPTHGGALLRD